MCTPHRCAVPAPPATVVCEGIDPFACEAACLPALMPRFACKHSLSFCFAIRVRPCEPVSICKKILPFLPMICIQKRSQSSSSLCIKSIPRNPPLPAPTSLNLIRSPYPTLPRPYFPQMQFLPPYHNLPRRVHAPSLSASLSGLVRRTCTIFGVTNDHAFPPPLFHRAFPCRWSCAASPGSRPCTP
jgi:hypothetical protein